MAAAVGRPLLLDAHLCGAGGCGRRASDQQTDHKPTAPVRWAPLSGGSAGGCLFMDGPIAQRFVIRGVAFVMEALSLSCCGGGGIGFSFGELCCLLAACLT